MYRYLMYIFFVFFIQAGRTVSVANKKMTITFNIPQMLPYLVPALNKTKDNETKFNNSIEIIRKKQRKRELELEDEIDRWKAQKTSNV